MTNLDMYGRKLNVDEEDNEEQEYKNCQHALNKFMTIFLYKIELFFFKIMREKNHSFPIISTWLKVVKVISIFKKSYLHSLEHFSHKHLH